MMRDFTRYLRALLVPVVLFGLAPATFAADGVVLINQATSINGLPGCGSHGFPIVICQPGSYRLSGNLSVPGDGIFITADNTTVDLNGFAIVGAGPNANGGAFSVGITGSGSFGTISNGTIRGFTFGIELFGFDGRARLTVRNLTILDVNNGIDIAAGIVADTTVEGSGVGHAIEVGEGRVERCRVTNSEVGIVVARGLVLGNEIVGNTLDGLSGNAGGYGLNVFINNGHDVGLGNPSFFSQGNNVCSTGKC